MKTTQKALLTSVTAALAISLGASAVAAENPFALKTLSSGYQVADNREGKAGEGKCGTGKCGAGAKDKSKNGTCHHDKAKAKDGSCGHDKAKEGSCGGDKAKEGSCSAEKMKEGKCGTGKCGAEKK